MLLSKYKKLTKKSLGLIGVGLVTVAAIAAIVAFTPPEKLSENSLANKTKLIRMGNGWLVTAYGDATFDDSGAGRIVYDTKADDVRLARDIYVKTCHPANNASQCSLASDWSDPINISETALLSSISTDWNENPGVIGATPFYGDSEKPNIFNAGNFVAVSWVGKYCPGGQQRMISYNEREGLTVPFSCVYVAYTNNVAGVDGQPAEWYSERLTDGSRDAKSDFNKGLSVATADGAKANWAISWQEDPHGLQLGGADGPGEGASGAAVTHGTDVWYTFTEDLMSTQWAEPVRISDNYTNDGQGGNTSPVFHPDDLENEITSLERGNTGASRPNLMLVGGSNPGTAVIAYEESKGADRLDSGKFIRYHHFAYNNPPAANSQYENGEPGCIISDPLENSRRVRFVGQAFPSANGLRMGVFWRQGLPTEGGPGDIMVRVGTTAAFGTGLSPEDMLPTVDPNCRETEYLVARDLVNQPGYNISSNTVPWSPVGEEPEDPSIVNQLSDTTSENPYEDSRAHRAAIVGDNFYIGYSYAKDWALATYSDLDNYNFWLRHFNMATNTWTDAKNLSGIAVEEKIHVKEPRLVKTPGSGMGCGTTYDENCQNKETLIVAWGTETNVYSHVQSSEEGEIYYTRSRNKGVDFDDAVYVADIGVNNRFESQLRPSPAGNIIWSVWNEADNVEGGSHAMLSVSDESEGVPPAPPAGSEPPPPPPTDDTYDLMLQALETPLKVLIGGTGLIEVEVANSGPADSSGTITVTGVSNKGFTVVFTDNFTDLEIGEKEYFSWTWTAPDINRPDTFYWTATVSSSGEDTNLLNNTATSKTKVRRH